tara:strand:- start:332 stop:817 length:486 start_codon:yes stop_codon:yes gene_type:complete
MACAYSWLNSGYWLEIVRRDPESGIQIPFNLSQTMLRVKDPKKSLKFYEEHFGMRRLCERHFPDSKFSLYFLTSGDEKGVRKLPCKNRVQFKSILLSYLYSVAFVFYSLSRRVKSTLQTPTRPVPRSSAGLILFWSSLTIMALKVITDRVVRQEPLHRIFS